MQTNTRVHLRACWSNCSMKRMGEECLLFTFAFCMTAKTCSRSDSDKAVKSGSPKFDLLLAEEAMANFRSRELIQICWCKNQYQYSSLLNVKVIDNFMMVKNTSTHAHTVIKYRLNSRTHSIYLYMSVCLPACLSPSVHPSIHHPSIHPPPSHPFTNKSENL